MRQNDIRIKSAVVSLSSSSSSSSSLSSSSSVCVSGECANVSMKKEIIRSFVSPLFWVVWSFVVGLFSFVCKKMKKGAPLLSSIILFMLVCRRTFRERERERDEFNLSNSNNNNNNKRCFLSLYSLLLV
jgi:hypothetical protein